MKVSEWHGMSPARPWAQNLHDVSRTPKTVVATLTASRYVKRSLSCTRASKNSKCVYMRMQVTLDHVF